MKKSRLLLDRRMDAKQQISSKFKISIRLLTDEEIKDFIHFFHSQMPKLKRTVDTSFNQI